MEINCCRKYIQYHQHSSSCITGPYVFAILIILTNIWQHPLEKPNRPLNNLNMHNQQLLLQTGTKHLNIHLKNKFLK